MIEIKINKEIRDYTESVFFGLSLRQCVFSALAILTAVLVFMLLKPLLGLETVSWVCVLAAAPPALLGFFKYNGMHAEQFIWAWIKSEILMPRKLVYKSNNIIYSLMEPVFERKQKEAVKNAENADEPAEKG